MTSPGPTTPRRRLQGAGIRPKKTLGQNFLQDDTHTEAIASAIANSADKKFPWAVEIGPGTGALTASLLQRQLQLVAVERDQRMVDILQEDFAEPIQKGRLEIMHEDAARLDASALFAPRHGIKAVLCGNLPYHLSSTLLIFAAEQMARINGAIFLLQKEVVERVAAPPGIKAFGVISVLVQARYEAYNIRSVPAGAFWPPPKVDSAVLQLVPRQKPLDENVDWDVFRKVVKTAFSQRRKQLRNTLKTLFPDDEELKALDIDPSRRAETLSVADFVRLAERLAEKESAGDA